ncbi:MAG: CoA ester lyase [Halobacteriales archaeon]
MPRRSLLFTPGDRPDMLRKTGDTDADVVVFDLEDAVAPADKANARDTVREVLADPEFDPDAEVCVRLNPVGLGAKDDITVLGDGAGRPDSVMLPKTNDAAVVETLGRVLDEHDMPTTVIALVESAAGVLHAESIARADQTDAIAFGAEDLTADVGATRTDEGTEVLYAREHVVLAAGAAGIDAIDTPYTDFGDEAGLREETRFAIQLGYDGKLAIHPAQIAPINEAFTPQQEDVEWARRVLRGRDEHDGGVFRVDDEMIDGPLVDRAERIVERWEAANST